MNTFVLLTSSLSAVLAWATKRVIRRQLSCFYTIIGGGIFLMIKSVEWSYEISMGYTIQSNAFWHFYYQQQVFTLTLLRE